MSVTRIGAMLQPALVRTASAVADTSSTLVDRLLAFFGKTIRASEETAGGADATTWFSRRHFGRVLTEPVPAGTLEPLPPPADVLVPHANRVVTIREKRASDRLQTAEDARDNIGIGIGRERLGQHFDRDVAIEAHVPRAVDRAHPAGADLGDDFIGTEP